MLIYWSKLFHQYRGKTWQSRFLFRFKSKRAARIYILIMLNGKLKTGNEMKETAHTTDPVLNMVIWSIQRPPDSMVLLPETVLRWCNLIARKEKMPSFPFNSLEQNCLVHFHSSHDLVVVLTTCSCNIPAETVRASVRKFETVFLPSLFSVILRCTFL